MRFLVVRQELQQYSLEQIGAWGVDTKEYVRLAHNIATTGRFVASNEPGERYLGLIRTPDYPFFCAIFEKLGWYPGGVLWTQALLGGGISLTVFCLGRWLFASRWIGIFAGLGSAFSACGLNLIQVILVDVLFSAVFLAGFASFWAGVRGQKRGWLMAAALLFVLAVLIKPTLLFWPFCVPVIWIVLARGYRQPIRVSWMAIFILIQVIGMGAWCARNYITEGTLSFCAIDGRNLRMWIAPTVRVWARHQKYPNLSAKMLNRHLASEHERDLLAQGLPPASVAQRMRLEALAIFRRYPMLTLRVYFDDNIANQLGLTKEWDPDDLNLFQDSAARRMLLVVDAIMLPIWTNWVVLVLTAGSVLVPLLTPRRLRGERWRYEYAVVIVLLLTYAYFVAMAGSTHSQGPRILYPVQFATILLVCFSARGLLAWLVRQFGRSSSS